LLLALWPAAMLHCDLEAAGLDWPLLVHHDHDDADGHGHSDESSSAIHPSDDLSLQGAWSGLKVRCPELWLLAEQAPLVLCSCEVQATSPPPRTNEPFSWIRVWRFEQRAALPARAPDVRA
jgi:hypothetical protein